MGLLGIVSNTPIEKYFIGEIPIWVKREDLCAPPGAPPFSKIRGIADHLIKLKLNGISIVGYTETSISMAGWAIAWAASQIDMHTVIFNPIYKGSQPELEYHREQWKKYRAEIIDIKAGMAKVNYYLSKKILKEKYGTGAVMLPLGMSVPESITATEDEARLHSKTNLFPSVVTCVGSGTICAGLIRAFDERTHIYGIMTRTGNIVQKKKHIMEKSSRVSWDYQPKFTLIDPGYQYTQPAEINVPWPTNRFYDAKAVLWLIKNIKELSKPILFWNIGSNSI